MDTLKKSDYEKLGKWLCKRFGVYCVDNTKGLKRTIKFSVELLDYIIDSAYQQTANYKDMICATKEIFDVMRNYIISFLQPLSDIEEDDIEEYDLDEATSADNIGTALAKAGGMVLLVGGFSSENALRVAENMIRENGEFYCAHSEMDGRFDFLFAGENIDKYDRSLREDNESSSETHDPPVIPETETKNRDERSS